ncbi:MAG: zinc ribbon domain-containing protein [Planctomycetota bacterium]|nr:MAG: zinc ribbon domain-containing protein [Planctomycetota bacterium]REJ88973.1 MAG: zinc ribbon domain-containing protein [Planctomycetota bacterium]REK31221.1 MAG: zinc ribbon domain-containing protein [Planctomycetota bacterium]REK43559.1 MAG: zinc ribbon domain-containing protein [Planctomycetota bacterium]
MPTYDYVCDGCGHEFELFQSISAPVEKKCPECKKNKLRRLFGTGAAVVFKGSGFYETDYRSESYKKGAQDAQKAKDSAQKAKDSATGDAKESKSKNDGASSGKSADNKSD